MREARFSLGSLLVVAVLLLPSGVNAQEKSKGWHVAGHITALVPEDKVLREDQTMAAAKDMVLKWRDVLETGREGRVRIELSDGSIINLSSDAQLEILKHDARRQKTSLQLLYGRLLANAIQIARPGGRFDVRTPTAVAGVVGTSFGVLANPAATDVLCREGVVRVRNADKHVRGEVLVHAGEFTHVERGKPPSPPAPASPERIRAGEDATSIPNSP